MCGRFGITHIEDLESRYDLGYGTAERRLREIIKPNYNLTPSQYAPVILNINGRKVLEEMKWGLIPFWAKDIRIGAKMINARAEGIEVKPAFRKPIRTQRCLIPASFFFEWGIVNKEKLPFLFKLKNTNLFSFAGIYDVVKGADGHDIKSFSIITTEPNSVVEPIHSRMPLILSQADEDKWISELSLNEILELLKPYPATDMERFLVSKLVNDTSINDPRIVQPAQN